jgi:hypothetical protein
VKRKRRLYVVGVDGENSIVAGTDHWGNRIHLLPLTMKEALSERVGRQHVYKLTLIPLIQLRRKRVPHAK